MTVPKIFLILFVISVINPARIASEGNFIILRTFEQVLGKHLKNKLVAKRVINLKKWFKIKPDKQL